jgi:murein DD-endopeptidase MepM/ murein hydrolase activator NlpD
VVPLGTVFATADGIELVVPAAEIEVIGYHEANHDGTRQMQPVDSPVPYRTLDSRNRGTQSRTAADMVVNPNQPVYSPVTGTVLRAGGYVLYCEHDDDFLVIEPDGRPGIEVKLLHINGVTVGAGDRVEAGVTLVAPGPTPLPFESQVDEYTGEPSWAHVHVEVVDTSIPDIPAPGGGGGC